MAKKTQQELYNEAKIRGYCSPYIRGQFALAGFDISMLKITEEVKPKAKPKKDKSEADFLLDEALGRC